MKLILAILRDEDSEPVSHSLTSAGFRVTRIASTGGFLRKGSTTMIIGAEDDQIDRAIQLVQESCSPPPEPGQRRATLFVWKVDHFTQL